MLHGVSFRLLHNPPLADIQALFARLKADGCDAISIIPHHYVSLEPGTANLGPPPAGFNPPWFIYPDLGQDPTHPFHNTPEPELVLAACQAAAGLGMRVMLKPHIDCYQAGWRGDISVKSRASDWVWAYRNRFLQRYLDMAKQVHDTILCLGCELYTVTKDLGPEFWIGMADWARGQGFKGPLTYAANWGGWAGDAEYRRLETLWPHLDYIGVDAYFPLFPAGYSGPTDVNALVAAWHRKGIDVDWCPHIDEDLIAISKSTGKPLIFAEIGYGNHQQAPMEPMRDAKPDDVADEQLQLRLGQAFRQKWGPVPQFQGYFWWEAWLQPPTPPAISHDIMGRPIEKVIFQPLPGEGGSGGPGPDPGSPPTPTPVPAPTPAPSGTPVPPPATSWAKAPSVADILARNGVHAPNCPFPQFSRTPGGTADGAAACWARVQAAHAHWIKLLVPDHGRADAEHARALGMQVLVRAAGEGFPNVADVQALIQEFRGVCDVIEVGNEPYMNDKYHTMDEVWWNHAWVLEAVWVQCSDAAHAAGIQLCTPGWQAAMNPPSADTVNSQALADRLRTVYSKYDAIGVHTYDVFNLATPAALDRLDRWHAMFNKPIYITEYGIAARYLLPGQTDPAGQPASDLEKVNRYAAFLRRVAALPYVPAAFLFLLGGTHDWASFRNGVYDPNGDSSYWLDEAAYAALGNALTDTSRDLDGLGAEGAARDLGGRPHGPDYPIMSVPTISPDVYARVLASHHSPALNDGAALTYYRAAQDRGINPAVAVAFFEHESQCDTEGPVSAAGAKNWGNLRPRNDGTIGRAKRRVQTQYGVFRGYDTHLDGLLDWCDLMHEVYAGMTIRQALKIYAPASDQNDPNSYAAIVLKRVAQWDQESGDFTPSGAPPVPAPPPTPAPAPAPSDTPDFPLLATPTVSADAFTATLAAIHSPVLDEADGTTYYNLCVSNGVDPAVALAFFQQESNCGTTDGAAAHRNWGNLWDAAAHAVGSYDSWLLGLRDWCNRLQRPAYTAHGAPTIASIVPIYGPAGAQQHGNAWYIGQLSARISRLQGT